MKLRKNMQDALNKQIAHEFKAKMLYLQMSAYFEDLNLKGFANWMRKQADEEDVHAMKIFDFINDRDGKVTLHEIEKPKASFKSILDVVQTALGHERRVTELINKLVGLAQKEKDHATREFLDWFVAEQVEEEDQGQWLVDQVTLAGSEKSALLLLDRELAQRKD